MVKFLILYLFAHSLNSHLFLWYCIIPLYCHRGVTTMQAERQARVVELVNNEQEYVKDLDFIVTVCY